MKRQEKIIKWFQSEQIKDDRELEVGKKRIINEIKGLKKEDLFIQNKKEEVKLSLWQKIRIMIWGN